ncbi:unnamed protein product, partial [Rotaria magnacalcarata]
DVQLQIRNLYLSHEDSNQTNNEGSTVNDSLSTSSSDTITHQGSISITTNESSNENSSHHKGITI